MTGPGAPRRGVDHGARSGPPPIPVLHRLRAVPPSAVAIGALVLTTALWALLQRAEPFLGHDESIYAGRARSLVTGAPAAGWMVYRPIGLPVLGSLALRIHQSTGAVRAVALVLSLLTLIAVYLVGARVTTPRRSAAAVLVVVSGATFLRRMPEFLDDIPSAGLLLLTAYLVLRSRRPGGRWALPAAAGVGAIAVLTRYGASAGLITIAAAAVVVWGPRVWLRAWREVAAAGAVLLAGLAPLVLVSLRQTGSPVGLLLQAEVTAHRAFLGEGLVDYLRAFPTKLAGPLGAVVILAALAALPIAARTLLTGRHGEAGTSTAELAAARERLFLAIAALAELLLLGLVAHGESRFALFTVITLTVLGVDALARAAGRYRPVLLTATAGLALLATGATAVLVYRQMSEVTAPVDAVASVAAQLPGPVRGPAARGKVPLAGAAPLAGTPAGGAACLVVTRLAVEAAWVSGCDGARPGQVEHLPDAVRVYVIDFPGTPGWSALSRMRSLAPARTWTIRRVPSSGPLGDALIAVSAPLTAASDR